ncbi:hypothetical protein Tco_1393476 [Tanacetum coccineum]
MIGSLMYLTSSRPDIMFSVCACSRFQVQPKVSHLNAVKRIFRYLKGRPKLGLWYPKDSPFILEAFSDSDYAGASLDRKSTTGGCQFLGSRLISWQCKKQTVVANSTTEAEYIAASHCCGQVLWIQNQMLDYGYNFMQTKIHVDNESAICVVKNPVYHSKTKHIEIRHHFIRDSYEKKLIEMVKIHTDYNVADLLTKAFDVTRFQFLIASIVDTLIEALFEEKLYGTMCINAVDYTTWILRMECKSLELQDKKELAIPGQTTTGKEFSNLLMAGSLPKTITCLEKSDENAKFHQIVDFLSTCSINYALTAVDISESSVRSDLLFDGEDGVTCLTNDEIFENLALMRYEQLSTKLTFKKGGDSVERAITIVASLDAAQDSDNIIRTQTTAMPNVDIPQGMDTGGSPRHQETIGGTPAQTRMEHTFELTDNVPYTPYDSPLPGVGRMKLDELITLCTKLSKQVLYLEKENDAQAMEILNLKRRLKKLERKRKSSISHPRRRKYR